VVIADWRFVLAHSYGDLPHIGDLLEASNKSLAVTLNRPGSFTCSLPLNAEISYEISPVETCVKAIKNGNCVWSGPVMQMREQAEANKLELTCNGWFDLLNYRFFRADVDLGVAMDHTIVFTVINDHANSSSLLVPSKVIDGETLFAPSPSWIISGSTIPDESNGDTFREVARSTPFTAWSSNIGQEITRLSDIEDGFDFEVDSITREFNIWRKKMKTSDALFGYASEPQNLRDATRETDATQMRNWFHVVGSSGAGDAYDNTTASSIPRLGYFEENVSLSSVGDAEILGAYGNAEIVLRQYPIQTHSVEPFPIRAEGNVPSIFEDYDIGDLLHFVVRQGRFDTGENPQGFRLFGATIAVDEQGDEKVSSMQIYYSGS
jgi:hypothetical protein